MPKPSLREGCSKTSASATTCVERRRRDTETRRLSHSHTDGAAAAWRRADAIDANLKFRKPQKQTLSQRLVAAFFVEVNKVFARSEFRGIQDVQ